MSSNGDTSNGGGQSPTRRGSFSPGSLSSWFSSNRAPSGQPVYPGPITSAAVQANNRRRMSISGVPGAVPVPGAQPLSIDTARRGSISSTTSSASYFDENAIDDSSENGSPSSVGSPFTRRMSWGASALKDVKIPSASGRAGSFPSSGPTSPIITRGFWTDSKSPTQPRADPIAMQKRRQSIAVMPPTTAPAAKEPALDSMQERMLKGDLFMD